MELSLQPLPLSVKLLMSSKARAGIKYKYLNCNEVGAKTHVEKPPNLICFSGWQCLPPAKTIPLKAEVH